jgi:hypothetical protein
LRFALQNANLDYTQYKRFLSRNQREEKKGETKMNAQTLKTSNKVYAIFIGNNFEPVESKIIHTFEAKEKNEEQIIKAACRWIHKNYSPLYVNDNRSLWVSENGETYHRVMGLN